MRLRAVIRLLPSTQSKALLTRRRYPEDEREKISNDRWAFARIEGKVGLDNQGAETAIVRLYTRLAHDGFEPGWIYEIVYTGRDPLVMGLNIAVRDFVSFLGDARSISTHSVMRLRKRMRGGVLKQVDASGT